MRCNDSFGADLAAAWSSILIFDATVFGLTLWQALHFGRMWSHSLFHIILRDGERLFRLYLVFYLAPPRNFVLTRILFRFIYRNNILLVCCIACGERASVDLHLAYDRILAICYTANIMTNLVCYSPFFLFPPLFLSDRAPSPPFYLRSWHW